MTSHLRFQITLILLLLLGCSVQRQAIAPGVIPAQRTPSRVESNTGRQVLEALRRQFPVVNAERPNRRVRRIVDNLARATSGTPSRWRAYVLKGDSVINAAATQGNYIFVWTGMLRVVQDDNELASVLAHELAHVLAGHTRKTPGEEANAIFAEIAGVAAGQAASGAGASLAGNLVKQVVEGFIVNPESQRKELEADQIGLFLMARAGYNPRDAVDFWRRLKNRPEFTGQGPGFFSTHPTSNERIRELEKHLPAALKEYRGNRLPDTFDRKPKKKERDSFDHLDFEKPRSRGEIWIVQEEWTPVYELPDRRSKIINHIFYGRAVRAERSDGRWLKVIEPVSGYVRGRDLAPK